MLMGKNRADGTITFRYTNGVLSDLMNYCDTAPENVTESSISSCDHTIIICVYNFIRMLD